MSEEWEEDFFIINVSPHTNNENDDLLRAVIPGHLHQFPYIRDREVRRIGHIHYPIPIYNIDGTLSRSLYFRFDLVDWRFHWSGPNSHSFQLVITTLNRQFAALRPFYQDLRGENYPFPLPNFTKVQITKRGRYHLQAGLVAGHTDRNLKVQTLDGSIYLVRQQFTFILDPNETLPFGIPCVREG